MDIKDTKNKSNIFTNGDIMEIEVNLFPAIRLFHESNKKSTIRPNVQGYFIEYCLDRNLPLQETLIELNKLLHPHQRPKMEDIVPSSKKGQEHLIASVLFPLIIKKHAFLDSEKTSEIISSFCNLTGVTQETANPIINTLSKKKIKEIIETDLYDMCRRIDLKLIDDNQKLEQKRYLIEESSKMLNVEEKYIQRLINSKKKKEDLENKQKNVVSSDIPTIQPTINDSHDER